MRGLSFFQAPLAFAIFFERKFLPAPPWALVSSRGLLWTLAGSGSRGHKVKAKPKAKGKDKNKANAKAKGKAKSKAKLKLKLKLSYS